MNFFEDQVSLSNPHSLRLAKHIIGTTAFIRWVNSFPEYNITFAGQGELVFSEYLSSFFSLSKDDSINTLYLGIQEREASWVKYLPFHSACVDETKARISLLCDGEKMGEKKLFPLNISIQVEGQWRLKQLSQMRRLIFISIKAKHGKVIEVGEQSIEPLNLYHQNISSVVANYQASLKRKSNIISSLID